ncbi:glycosyltransferase family 4 protein [Leifsonia naganoensis]|uniref:Glycosyltransferase involved in cell wall biosynthesis n=1 Tax=Leifsonia naganoensis TaxID=150025 RepID=A0A853DSY6_9MICO|nr:glycosyltransferase family 1 protein [Leifsonia naganoensis]NYK08745.1 glycosyltransferase involved in cell wall biosynthesis [Leifsonia naganoensis]
MTTLRVVIDELIGDAPGGARRYTEELTRQLLTTAPKGCDVVGIVSAVSDQQLDDLRLRLPGLADITRLPLAHRELTVAWQSGVRLGGIHGMVHAPTLLAPLRRRRSLQEGDQVAVTIHDTLAWTHPESLGAGTAMWTKAMAKRARKHADAVVVPTHAVAARLADELDFGDRIRVIGGAPATALRLPPDADARAARLNLPETYALTLGSIMPRKGVAPLIRAVARTEAHGIPLLIAGPDRFGDGSATGVAAAAGLPEDRVRALGQLEDADLAVVLDRATLFVYPSLAEGFGLPIVEAFKFGLPVIHSDDPALVEVAGGASLVVERPSPTDTDESGYTERLAAAIGRVLDDGALRERLSVLASDRARAFSWRDSAERVWQLHADL